MKTYLFIYLSFFLFIGCTPTPKKTENNSLKEEQKTVQYAKHFRFVTDEKGLNSVEIIHPDTKKVLIKLSPLKGNKNVIALSGTFIGMMDKLNLASNISGVSEMKYIFNPTIIENHKQNKLIEVGYDTQLALESIIVSKPAAILHSGYSNDFPHEKQFVNAGILCVPIFDWREETPLGKAEWIKVYGFLYGKSVDAETIFNDIEKRYNDLKKKAQELQPSELVLSGNIIGSEWYCPAGESFFAEFLKDANITYKYFDTKGSGSVALTQEKILSDNRKSKIWINPGAKTMNELKTMNPKAVLFDAFNLGNVYCHSQKENYYWEVSSIEPDKLLDDLLHIAHPELNPNYSFQFYSKLN